MMGMSVGFRNSTFPDRSPLKALSGCACGRRSIDALRPTRLPHTKWAWRHTAKCVICELGPVGNLSCVFCKMRQRIRTENGSRCGPAAVLDWVPRGIGSGTKAYAQPIFPLRVSIAAGFVIVVSRIRYLCHPLGQELERQAIHR